MPGPSPRREDEKNIKKYKTRKKYKKTKIQQKTTNKYKNTSGWVIKVCDLLDFGGSLVNTRKPNETIKTSKGILSVREIQAIYQAYKIKELIKSNTIVQLTKA